MSKPFSKLGLAVLLVMSSLLITPAHAEQDRVQFGSGIHVAKDDSIKDAVCFFCSVDAEGTVNGDVVVFFGSVHIAGQARRDVVNFFGTTTVDENASIGQDLVNFFGGVRLGENARVAKDVVVMFGGLRADDSATIHGDRVVQPAWIFWVPLMLLASGIVFIVREFRVQRYRRMTMRGY